MAAELGRPRCIGAEVITPEGNGILLDIIGPTALVDFDGRHVAFDEEDVRATRGWIDRRGEWDGVDRRR